MGLHSRTDRAYRSGVLRRVRPNAAHISGADGGRASGGVLYPACLSSLQTDVVLLALPILSALPFTAAFVDDHKSH